MAEEATGANVEDAILVIFDHLRRRSFGQSSAFSHYGYDMWVPSVVTEWVEQSRGLRGHEREMAARQDSAIFLEAAWEICRRGIIRPGIRQTGEQAVAGGCGYSLTVFGREWLTDLDESQRVSMQPGRLASVLASFEGHFGPGFVQRSQEAIRCRNAEAWLASCAMIGAAAESILMAFAIARLGDEETALKIYRSNNGRRKLIEKVTGELSEPLKRPFTTITGLLAYWHDESSHGTTTAITATEAEQALRELLKLAQFTMDNWEQLTTSQAEPIAIQYPQASAAE